MRGFLLRSGIRRQWVVLAVGFLCVVILGITYGCSGGSDESVQAPIEPIPTTPGPPGPGGGGPQAQVIEEKQFGPVTLLPDVSSGEFRVDVRGSSFMIVADGGDSSDIDINFVKDPQGAAFITRDFLDDDPIGRNHGQAVGHSTESVIFPQATYALKPGWYSFTVQNKDLVARQMKVKAIVNNRQNPSGGTFNVNLVFCGLPDLSAATALSGQSTASQRFLAIFDEFKRIYASANIRVATPKLFDCSKAEGNRLTFVDPLDANFNGQPDDLDDLFALSSRLQPNALTFFFVQDLADGAAGISGGIPGPALTPGTAHSGVAISTFGPVANLTPATAVIQGQTMAHEGGHFLGLFHTTERDAQLTDPIPDTPACPILRDKNRDGAVDAAECLNLDGLNLMFWGPPAPGTDQEILTAGQRFVLHRNPLIHE